MRQTFLFFFFLSSLCCASGQQDSGRIEKLRQQLDLRLAENPGLEQNVDLSVSNAPLAEFIRALGTKNKVNISVDSEVKGSVSNTFSNVSVTDVLLFLAQQYRLDLRFTGSIIHIKPYQEPAPPPLITIPKALPLYFDTASSKLTLELKNDTLSKVAKGITAATGRNIVFAPGLGNKLLTLYVEDVSFDQAMDKLAFANNLKISKTEDGFYLIENPTNDQKAGSESNLRFLDLANQPRSRFRVDSNLISLSADNRPTNELISGLFSNLNIDYFLYDQLQGNTTLHVKSLTLDELLSRIFAGTKYTFRKRNDIYLIGERTMEGLYETRQLPILNRAVEKITEYIPQNLKEQVEIKEMVDLNSLVLSGSYPKILEIESFIKSIDQPVPVVIIEVVIVDYQRNFTVSSGIEAGVGENAPPSGGQIYPGIDYTLNAESLNEIIKSFNGFGSLNLGPVTPNFYVNLKLLENNGLLNVRSTPKLSTLNGHKATLSIGNTEYYVVERVNIQGVQNPIPVQTRNYQSVEANFTLTIKPMVSSQDQVTLEIEVEQSDFTARISPEAPPGSVNRKFSSLIRVKNNEMILLGGLQEKGYDDTGAGVPLLSRIPFLRWLFSSRTRTDSKSKLNVFIKPIIIY